ncbi:MAG: hypothetical protein J6X28_05015 [Bacilli bacterium]|nr:hypothetical protein [Bacilli bacterium]
MITIYNKIEKSSENTSGFQVVDNIDLLERPFLLCISAQNNVSKTIYGMMREGAQAARILTTQGIAGKFILDEFPIDILGVRFQVDENYQQAYTEIADKFLFPFLMQKGNDFATVCKQARKMNIFAYCDGAFTYKGAEDRLEVLLKREQFNEEQIHGILSQISLTAMASLVETGSLHATSVAFIDVNDQEIESDKTDSYRNFLESEKRKFIYSPLGDSNGVLCVYQGNGIHSIKQFFRERTNVSEPALCSVVSLFLENSLQNEKSSHFIAIDVEQIMDRLERFANENIEPENLLLRLDDELDYNGAPRYTDEVAEMKMELDAVYKLLRKTNETFIRSLEQKKGQDLRLESVIRGIHEFSSDITYEQILTYAHLWNPKEGKDILSEPSDKQVRATIYSGEES